ncbi:hypothetical protein V2J09_021506 [Rumex salicifolius]
MKVNPIDALMEKDSRTDMDEQMEDGEASLKSVAESSQIFLGASRKGFQRVCRYLIRNNHIDILALMETHVSWQTVNMVINIHGHYIHSLVQIGEDRLHLNFWDVVALEIKDITEHMFIGGNFNCILSMDERQGGSGRVSVDSDRFLDWVNELELIDMGFMGPRFTWRRGDLIRWNRNVFGNTHKRKSHLLARIEGIQWALDKNAHPTLHTLDQKLREELDLTLEQEETLWFQKSRERWVAQGDRNTRYFHTNTIIRRRRNRISSLRDGQFIPLGHGGFPTIDETDQMLLNREPREEEIVAALNHMGRIKRQVWILWDPTSVYQLEQISGIDDTRDLGKYLGVLIFVTESPRPFSRRFSTKSMRARVARSVEHLALLVGSLLPRPCSPPSPSTQ